jgi:hypothetical protein
MKNVTLFTHNHSFYSFKNKKKVQIIHLHLIKIYFVERNTWLFINLKQVALVLFQLF